MTYIPASFLVNKQTTHSSIAAQIFWNSGLEELVWQEAKNHARKIGHEKGVLFSIEKSLIFLSNWSLNLYMLWMLWEASVLYAFMNCIQMHNLSALRSQLLFHDFRFTYLYFNPPISCVLETAEDLKQLIWGDRPALGRLGCKFFFYHKLCLILASLASSLSWFSFCITQ